LVSYMDSWKDKVVIIIGGGAGIGQATALLFAEAGARVVVTGRLSEPLKRLIQERDNVDFAAADAANPDDACRTIATTIERWRRLDVLVNNAGAGTILPLEPYEKGIQVVSF